MTARETVVTNLDTGEELRFPAEPPVTPAQLPEAWEGNRLRFQTVPPVTLADLFNS